jgi:hypothetical protein
MCALNAFSFILLIMEHNKGIHVHISHFEKNNLGVTVCSEADP